MYVKRDTKEKFTVFKPEAVEITEIMAGKLADMLLNQSRMQPPHVILNLENVISLSPEAAGTLAEAAESIRENNLSFVLCCPSGKILETIKDLDLEDILNITPTESEAWDIVQMEEVERELLKDEDENN